MVTLRQLKEFDTISIVENKEVLNIFNEIDVSPSDIIFFLDKGVIKCKIPCDDGEKITEYYYFEKIKENVWVLDIYTLHNYEFSESCMIAIDLSKKQKNCPFSFGVHFIKNIPKERKSYYDQVAYSYAMIFYGVFAHFTKSIRDSNIIMRKLKLRKIKSKENSNKIENTNKPSRRKIKLTSLNAIEYIVETSDDVYRKLQQLKKQEYKRQIEAWTVRGHIRKYKNGNEVYIKPYTKGEGELTGKEYVLIDN